MIFCICSAEEIAEGAEVEEEKPKSLSQALEEEQSKTTEKPKLPVPDIPEATGNIFI